MQLSQISIYPLKSGRGMTLAEALVEPRGLAFDRRWMIVDANGKFVSARQIARMVLIEAIPHAGGLRLETPGGGAILVAAPAADLRRRLVRVWKSDVMALDAGDDAALWLSDWLGVSVRLVHMDAAARRSIDPARGLAGDELSFADGYPLLLISQASLDGLNARLSQPLPMARFRPNLVVTADTPHREDGWRRVRISAVEFDVIKPCVRCVLTTVDPERGERDPSGEPLTTLKTYRRTAQGITFGVNLIPRTHGVVHCADAVEVLA